MSNIELFEQDAPDMERATDTQKQQMVPRPVGYKMLLALPEQERTYASGIIKADQTLVHDTQASIVAFVVSQGPDCYKDEKKFPTGPWCKEGDFVIIRPYSGTRVKVHGKEMRLINDDGIDAVVDDPRGITRIGG